VQASVRTTDRVVLFVGDSLGDRDDAVVEDLKDNEAELLLAALAEASGAGVTLSQDHQTINVLPAPPPPPPPPPAPNIEGLVTALLQAPELGQATKGQLIAALQGQTPAPPAAARRQKPSPRKARKR
jgi:hypothetical protein